MNVDQIIEEIDQKMVQAYQNQCDSDWEGCWKILEKIWSEYQPIIKMADSQPQIQQILTDEREIIPNTILQSIECPDPNIERTEQLFKSRPKKIKKRSVWSEEENRKLEAAIQRFGIKDTKNIVRFIGSRSAAQIRSKIQKMNKKLINR